MCIKPFYHDKYNKLLPCGGCVGCRLDKSLLWSARCASELKRGRSAFVTFTYDNDHLRYNDNALLPTLSKSDCYNFLDNLRHQVRSIKDVNMPFGCTKDYKYYIVGEYGDTFKRPHYHALFFGLDYHDFDSFFSKIWRFGSIKSECVCTKTINYVLSYITKSINGAYANKLYDDTLRVRPFHSNSKNFGLDYFIENSDDINRYGFVKINNRFVPVPTYYKNSFCKYDVDSVASRQSTALSLYHSFNSVACDSGFDSSADYRVYLRDVKFKSMRSRSLNNGIAFDDVYNCCKSVFKSSKLLVDCD